MVLRIIRGLIGLVGVTTGVATYFSVIKTFPQYALDSGLKVIVGSIVAGLVLGLIFYIVAPWIINGIKLLVGIIDKEISKYPSGDILVGSMGLIIGLLIAYLISQLLMSIQIPILGGTLAVITYGIMGYLGINIALKNKDEIANMNPLNKLSSTLKEKASKKDNSRIPAKILDTSVIIDGRIADICRTGFIEGKLIIPSFVLEELRHIADSSDDLKRVRGRRGLDILNIIQKELNIDVEISEKDFDDIAEVDSKLLKLGQVLNAKVVTNDYNLNKVAQFQGVEVLNINELANAIKPVAIPGEEMVVQVVKEGKESNQGIAYLDDGTMIVVDGGKKHMGETINVLVTSVLQTPAGRMIFGKPKIS